jgi:hypothetical protein
MTVYIDLTPIVEYIMQQDMNRMEIIRHLFYEHGCTLESAVHIERQIQNIIAFQKFEVTLDKFLSSSAEGAPAQDRITGWGTTRSVE